MLFQTTTNIQFNTVKPTNPIEGDTYYERSTNRVYIYTYGNWVMFQMYVGDKSEERVRKILSILNKLT